MSILSFVIIVVIASITGIFLGITAVLKSRGVSLSWSLLYAFDFFTFAFSIIDAHKELYNSRHEIFKKNIKKENYTKTQIRLLKKSLDTRKFKRYVIKLCIDNLIDFKGQIQFFMFVAEEHYRELPNTVKSGIKEEVKVKKEEKVQAREQKEISGILALMRLINAMMAIKKKESIGTFTFKDFYKDKMAN